MRVPLHRPWRGLMLRSNIRGIPGLRLRRCCGNPFGLRVFRYSILNRKQSAGFSSVSALCNFIPFPGSRPCTTSFRESTYLLAGAKIVRPSSQPFSFMFVSKFGNITLQNCFIELSSFLGEFFVFIFISVVISVGI